MWGIIATWRMAVEGISKASQVLAEGGDAGDAIEIAVREVEDFPYYKSVGYGGLPNEEMEVELDAAFMDGDTLDIGGVSFTHLPAHEKSRKIVCRLLLGKKKKQKNTKIQCLYMNKP